MESSQSDGRPIWESSDIAEFSVLLPGSQASAIEEIARIHGVTVGQMIRFLVRSHLNSSGNGGIDTSNHSNDL